MSSTSYRSRGRPRSRTKPRPSRRLLPRARNAAASVGSGKVAGVMAGTSRSPCRRRCARAASISATSAAFSVRRPSARKSMREPSQAEGWSIGVMSSPLEWRAPRGSACPNRIFFASSGWLARVMSSVLAEVYGQDRPAVTGSRTPDQGLIRSFARTCAGSSGMVMVSPSRQRVTKWRASRLSGLPDWPGVTMNRLRSRSARS